MLLFGCRRLLDNYFCENIVPWKKMMMMEKFNEIKLRHYVAHKSMSDENSPTTLAWQL